MNLRKNHKPFSLFWLTPVLSLFIGSLLFFSQAHVLRAANSCASAATGNWSAPETWMNCGGGIPTSFDSVTIRTGHILTVNTAAVAETVIINANATAGDNGLVINAGQSLSVTGAVTLNIPTVATTYIKVGAGSLAAASIEIPGSATARRFATVSVSSGTVTVSGSITFSGSAARARFTSTGPSVTTIGGDFGAGGTLKTDESGTFIFNGTVPQTINAYTTYNNVQINNSAGEVTLVDGLTTIHGTLDVNTGTLDMSSADVDVIGATTVNSMLKMSNSTGKKTFGDVTVANGGSLHLTVPATIGFNGNLILNGTGALSGSTGNLIFQKIGGGLLGGTTTNALLASTVVIRTNYSNSLSVAVTGTTTVSLGATLTNTGSFTAGGALEGANGTWTQGPNSILNIGLTSGIHTLNAATNTNSVRYVGAATQTVKATTYDTLDVSSNASGDANIGATTTANTALVLGPTIFSTDINTMVMGPGATLTRTSGFINGNLQKNVSNGFPTPTFEIGSGTAYSPVNLTFHGVTTSGDVLVNTTPHDHPSIATSPLLANQTVNRFYSVSASGVNFATYDAAFVFLPSDVDSGVNTANLVLEKYDAGTWSQPILSTRTATSITATDGTSFSDFQIGEPAIAPIPAPSVVPPPATILPQPIPPRRGNGGLPGTRTTPLDPNIPTPVDGVDAPLESLPVATNQVLPPTPGTGGTFVPPLSVTPALFDVSTEPGATPRPSAFQFIAFLILLFLVALLISFAVKRIKAYSKKRMEKNDIR